MYVIFYILVINIYIYILLGYIYGSSESVRYYQHIDIIKICVIYHGDILIINVYYWGTYMGIQNQFYILIIFDALHIYDIYTLHIDFAYYSVYAFPEMSPIPIGWLMKNDGFLQKAL